MIGNVFILGSFNVDMVSVTDRLPKPGETLMSKSSQLGVGGKGANQALSASNSGCNTHFVGKVGKDHFASYAHSHLSSSGINYILHESDSEPTGTALIFVSEVDGENMICIASGANQTLSDEEVISAKPLIDSSDVVLLQLEVNYSSLYRVIEIAKKNNKLVILNPAPYSSGVESILDQIDILTPNETEAEELTGIKIDSLDDAKLALIKLNQKGVSTPLITMGKKGVAFYHNNEFVFVPSYPAITVDTTGAGDAFNGALAAQLANKKSMLNAVKFACAYASLAVERQGAANMPSYEQTEIRLREVTVNPTLF